MIPTEIVKWERPPVPLSGIWAVDSPPSILHIQAHCGRPEALRLLERLPERGLGVVGTREPQNRCREITRQVIGELQKRDLVILSGFARGIDAAAHVAALEYGLPTIAILGCGLGFPYPREHQPLRERILEAGGLIVSEFSHSTEPLARNFHRRNRLIAGWSSATWVVQAGSRSGALNTAAHAAKLGRTIFTTPCFPGDPALAGNQKLVQNLQAHLLYDSRDLGEIWSELNAGVPQTKVGRPPAAGRQRAHPSLLARRVGELESAQGGARVDELLDWAVQEQGWLPLEFFDALSTALDGGLVRESGGALVAAKN